MRGIARSAAVIAGFAARLGPAPAAEILITIDKGAQRMTVSVDGQTRHAWPVSTGMAGYLTPAGSFKPVRLARTHFSREWDNAPMPHSIFFTASGHAIHGTGALGRLGRPASHGCVRLAGPHAAALFRLVGADPAGTRIEIVGTESVATGSALQGMRGITSFDPLMDGIMAGAAARRRRP